MTPASTPLWRSHRPLLPLSPGLPWLSRFGPEHGRPYCSGFRCSRTRSTYSLAINRLMRSELRAEANSQQGPFRPKARDILLSWTRAREYREGRSSRKIQSLGVGSGFKILHDRIITPGDGLIIFQGMQDATAESIKSLEGFRIAC